MEKTTTIGKSTLLIMLLLSIIKIYSQDQKNDSIKIHLKNNFYNDELYQDLKQKYDLTKTYESNDSLDILEFNCIYLTKYNFDSLTIKKIPNFKLKSNFNLKKNILNYINFKNEKIFFYNIYHKNKYLTSSLYAKSITPDPIFFDCEIAALFDNNLLVMMKLRLDEKYFIFQIDGIMNVLFIVDNGVVFAITEPKLNGEYKKTEINKFFRENYIRTDKFDSESSKNKRIKKHLTFFKSQYYFNIKH